jgi:hypothetical protein
MQKRPIHPIYQGSNLLRKSDHLPKHNGPGHGKLHPERRHVHRNNRRLENLSYPYHAVRHFPINLHTERLNYLSINIGKYNAWLRIILKHFEKRKRRSKLRRRKEI